MSADKMFIYVNRSHLNNGEHALYELAQAMALQASDTSAEFNPELGLLAKHDITHRNLAKKLTPALAHTLIDEIEVMGKPPTDSRLSRWLEDIAFAGILRDPSLIKTLPDYKNRSHPDYSKSHPEFIDSLPDYTRRNYQEAIHGLVAKDGSCELNSLPPPETMTANERRLAKIVADYDREGEEAQKILEKFRSDYTALYVKRHAADYALSEAAGKVQREIVLLLENPATKENAATLRQGMEEAKRLYETLKYTSGPEAEEMLRITRALPFTGPIKTHADALITAMETWKQSGKDLSEAFTAADQSLRSGSWLREGKITASADYFKPIMHPTKGLMNLDTYLDILHGEVHETAHTIYKTRQASAVASVASHAASPEHTVAPTPKETTSAERTAEDLSKTTGKMSSKTKWIIGGVAAAVVALGAVVMLKKKSHVEQEESRGQTLPAVPSQGRG